MACNGGLLDCNEGGCDIITCICAKYPVEGVILEDPTGSAYLEGGSGLTDPLRVCIEAQRTNETYGEVIVGVTDASGQVATTSHPLVDCKDCCDSFTITGSATMNPDTSQVLTVAPCCQDAEVTISGPDCGGVTTSLSPDGCSLTVTTGATACGTFTVTVFQNLEDCSLVTGTFTIRINNTGQGGAWSFDSAVATDCDGGSCDCRCATTTLAYAPCVDDDTGQKYGTNNGATFDCSVNFGYGCTNATAGCDVGAGPWPPCFSDPGGQCVAACGVCEPPNVEAQCIDKVWHKCNWSCSC
jgi:hypothetical protein